MLATVLIATGVAVFAQTPSPIVGSNDSQAIRSEVESAHVAYHSDVADALSKLDEHQSSVLFVHVDWASMIHHRERFCEFAREYGRTHPASGLVFHYIDCTSITDGYEPLRSLPGWKRLEGDPPRSLIHGHGEIAWMKSGSVLQVDPILGHGTAEDLVTTTELLLTAENHRTKR